MKYFVFGYWFTCCLIGGASVGHWETKCPNDPQAPMTEVAAFVLVAPVMVGYFFTAPASLRPCKVRP
jgi:tellurite resistance protein TehA-like permease